MLRRTGLVGEREDLFDYQVVSQEYSGEAHINCSLLELMSLLKFKESSSILYRIKASQDENLRELLR